MASIRITCCHTSLVSNRLTAIIGSNQDGAPGIKRVEIIIITRRNSILITPINKGDRSGADVKHLTRHQPSDAPLGPSAGEKSCPLVSGTQSSGVLKAGQPLACDPTLTRGARHLARLGPHQDQRISSTTSLWVWGEMTLVSQRRLPVGDKAAPQSRYLAISGANV